MVDAADLIALAIVETRAIYADPVLSKYAIDPARPIRIVVANGHVTLYGVVYTSIILLFGLILFEDRDLA